MADPTVLQGLKARLGALSPDSQRRWGSLTAHEMLCHLGDAGEMALRIRPRKTPVPHRRRPIMKWIGLWTPLRWPHGWKTNASQDPKREGTKPAQFARDRDRVISGLERLANPDGLSLEPVHGAFGLMSARDWQRWAYKHVDHHLRQFGV